MRTTFRSLFFLFLLLVAVGCKKSDNVDAGSDSSNVKDNANKLNRIGHVIVLYMENHSFDNLYGEFPNANGFSNSSFKQVDASDRPYQYLPTVPGINVFPDNLPDAPFNIDQYLPANLNTPNPTHLFYTEQQQIDGGKMDKFVLESNAKAFVMGYYKTAELPFAAEASRYTLCDNFFHSAFGGSLLNHLWLIAAAPPLFPNAPSAIVAKTDTTKKQMDDGLVSPDGYLVNNAYSINFHPSIQNLNQLVRGQTMPTIGDRLSAKNIDWAWYSEGWNRAISGNPDPSFGYWDKPFVYFNHYAPGTTGWQNHLKDEDDFTRAARDGTLPAVSFVKPLGMDSEHPGVSDASVINGEKRMVDLINAVRNGPNWNDTVIIVTYDENGGFWDHVAPPVIDRWGPGTRVPCILISPLVKQGFVDHTQYETVSILSLIEKRWNLQPLSSRDANAHYFENAFNF